MKPDWLLELEQIGAEWRAVRKKHPGAIGGCGLKKKHKTLEKAEAAIAHSLEKWGTTMFTYHCVVCGEWHLTRKAPRQ